MFSQKSLLKRDKQSSVGVITSLATTTLKTLSFYFFFISFFLFCFFLNLIITFILIFAITTFCLLVLIHGFNYFIKEIKSYNCEGSFATTTVHNEDYRAF